MSFFSRKITDMVIRKLEKPRKGEAGKVHLPAFLAILGGICAVPFLILGMTSLYKGEPLSALIFFIIASVGVAMIVGYINCRITYDKLGFTAKNFLGIKRHFTYDQITGIRFGIQETHIYVGKHRYMVDDIAVGGSEFLAFASKRYRAVSNRRSIPEVHKSGFDLFRGNIRNPGLFLFLYILIGALTLGVLIYFVCDIYVPSTPDNTLKEDLYFQSLTVEEDTLIFDALNGKIYKLSFIDESIDIQALRAVCDGETALRVYSREYTPKDKAPWYSVKAMMLRDQPILDFAESDRLYRQEYWPILLLFGGFCLFWGIYVAASIAVGRNPKKYSRKTVKRFFKEEYLKY